MTTLTPDLSRITHVPLKERIKQKAERGPTVNIYTNGNRGKHVRLNELARSHIWPSYTTTYVELAVKEFDNVPHLVITGRPTGRYSLSVNGSIWAEDITAFIDLCGLVFVSRGIPAIASRPRELRVPLGVGR